MYNIIIKSILRGDKMKKIEEKILEVFFSRDKKAPVYVLNKRDMVKKYVDGGASYYLWNTELVRKDKQGNIKIFPSSSTSEDYQYYRYGRNDYPPISQTTRSRLNAFIWEVLNTSGFYQKNWELYFGAEKIETDVWYKLDRENKKLVKAE
jgi:hypothetical protein